MPGLSRELSAEGAKQIVVVSDDPAKYTAQAGLAPGVTVRHRDELDAVQRELREMPGATVIIYDQACATKKRRERKRGTMPDPEKRVVINELVCEGCGDCSVQSNCLAVQPVETPFGRKRAVNQDTCNKDFSCVKGFCPSFVTVEGGKLKKASASAGKRRSPPTDIPMPRLPSAASRAPHRGCGRGRNRHRHHWPGTGHGGPYRGQGGRHPGCDRHGADGRRHLEPYPDCGPA